MKIVLLWGAADEVLGLCFAFEMAEIEDVCCGGCADSLCRVEGYAMNGLGH